MASNSTSSPAPAQTFAFITHSPATLPNNLPPDVDDAKLARRRRRRTSIKDQAILEAEYAKNDRPDKPTRREIADRIGLEEKQVQIWFQNRRQTNRRKSKPLRAHEMLPRNGGRCLDLSSDPFISSPYNPKTDAAEIPSPSSRASSPCPAVEPVVKTEIDVQQPRDTEVHMSDATEPDVNIAVSVTASVSSSIEQPDIARKTSPIHFLLNPAAETPNTSFQSQSTIADEAEFSQPTSLVKTAESQSHIHTHSPTPLPAYANPRRTGLIADTTPKLLKRSSSQVRLSMSFDGKATVVLEDEEEAVASPHSSQTSASTLVDSQSSFHEHACTPPKRRTVDAKIWESCCDSQSSMPAEPVKEDSPRKALKAIRARGVVAAAKAAADARKQRATTTDTATKKKVLGPKSTNGTVPSAATATPGAKKSKVQRVSPTKKDKPRKVVTATHKGPKKATPSPPLSAVKSHNRSPFRGLEKTLNGNGGNGKDKPGFTIYQSSDEGDSEKENWDPTSKNRRSRVPQQPSWRSKTGRNILGDLAGERVPQPNELEVIENLMSLRDGLWPRDPSLLRSSLRRRAHRYRRRRTYVQSRVPSTGQKDGTGTMRLIGPPVPQRRSFARCLPPYLLALCSLFSTASPPPPSSSHSSSSSSSCASSSPLFAGPGGTSRSLHAASNANTNPPTAAPRRRHHHRPSRPSRRLLAKLAASAERRKALVDGCGGVGGSSLKLGRRCNSSLASITGLTQELIRITAFRPSSLTAVASIPLGMAPPAADHLVVLVHGLWGNPSHMEYIASTMRSRYDDSRVIVHVAARNSGNYTYDGIELGGERLAHEIEELLDDLADRGVVIRKFSIAGYSLGGLVSRYVVGLLYAKGLFDKITPVNFTTFASPHLGVRTPKLGFHNHIWNVIGARTLSASGRQLFTIDRFRDTKRPLLAVLADKELVFWKALARFKNRVLYANIINDRSTTFFTSGISRSDPYADLDMVDYKYLPGYGNVLIDDDAGVKLRPPVEEEHSSSKAVEKSGGRTIRDFIRDLPFVALYALMVPVGFCFFLVNAGIQTYSSAKRIRLHGPAKYHVPLIRNEVQEAVDSVIDSINQAQVPDHLPADVEENAAGGNDGISEAKVQMAEAAAAATAANMPEFPTLALAPHHHAAIIVRNPANEAFSEGKMVIKHWLDEQFEV
ncbi:hypothetical protein Dda_5750 [Drechslerella dactyloides]|uniref:Homeobox domain-containing protein n=1 Tax=Drechslerella dactyloides TaxID=74499 RepID=A0AAD6IWH5_DREDA|nr:hypothetical protein Dda_5750 [Drechslerella dactyloides]